MDERVERLAALNNASNHRIHSFFTLTFRSVVLYDNIFQEKQTSPFAGSGARDNEILHEANFPGLRARSRHPIVSVGKQYYAVQYSTVLHVGRTSPPSSQSHHPSHAIRAEIALDFTDELEYSSHVCGRGGENGEAQRLSSLLKDTVIEIFY